MKEYPKLNEALANILRSRREELKLSKRKLAELAYLERTYVIQLEQGKKRPTLNALFYLSEALGIRADKLICLIEDELERMAQENQ
ncbi:helix-turn-helix transcriptional regulator [uncultured Desulfovibrio sp.]|uniref:helix-turn-helix domain-containing protein n=1 Tax=uncultured Desulfovibrio sp. TaxID=167968 RepID=UPI002597D2A8|nr:helix-turn-helix transcriptional regulator [uncultured Desulfovibrio sp.]